jgi:hypothetical protein
MLKKVVPVLLIATAWGCTSTTSTLLNRTDSNHVVGNSNGFTRAAGQSRPFKGVPITVRLPTHLDVTIKESDLYKDAAPPDHLTRIPNATSRSVETALVETDKVFTVDPKRPAAGNLTQTLDFGAGENSQYFQQIKYKIEDETIKDINAALNTLLPRIPTTTKGKSASSDLPEGVREMSRVVAWKRFDIDSPDFEQKVIAFVEMHLQTTTR